MPRYAIKRRVSDLEQKARSNQVVHNADAIRPKNSHPTAAGDIGEQLLLRHTFG
ncbi:MAG: hypothetical protein AMXMBFR59_39490 [Rhodanobacteraceae bacterium]